VHREITADTMVKTFPTMFWETDTIVYAAKTILSGAATVGIFINTMFPIPETLVLGKQTISSIIATILPVAGTMVAGLDAMAFVPHPKVFLSEAMDFVSETMVSGNS